MQVLQWNIDRDLRKEAETREVFERHLAWVTDLHILQYITFCRLHVIFSYYKHLGIVSDISQKEANTPQHTIFKVIHWATLYTVAHTILRTNKGELSTEVNSVHFTYNQRLTSSQYAICKVFVVNLKQIVVAHFISWYSSLHLLPKAIFWKEVDKNVLFPMNLTIKTRRKNNENKSCIRRLYNMWICWM